MKLRYITAMIIMGSCAMVQTAKAQQYYVNISASLGSCGTPPCSGTITFNETNASVSGATLDVSQELTISASTPPTTYSFSYTGECGPPFCNFSGSSSGDMPSQYSGTASFSNGSGSFTYCYEPAMPTIQMSDVVCGDDAVQLSMNVWAYSYLWQVSTDGTTWSDLKTINAATGSHLESSTIAVTTSDLDDLYSSVYGPSFYFRVIVTGCKERTSATTTGISFSALPPTVTLTGSSDVVCYGQENGTATLNITAGTSAVTEFFITATNLDATQYSFDVGEFSAGTQIVQNLRAGNWAFIVKNNTDKDNLKICGNTVTHTVNQPSQVTVSFQQTRHNGYDVSCHGGTDAQVLAVGANGTGTYDTYAWTLGSTSVGDDATLSGVAAGTYTATITDSDGCTGQNNIQLTQPPTALSAPLSVTSSHGTYDVSCLDATDGALSVTPTGGVSPYTYDWTDGISTTSTASNLAANTEYTVTVTDANGCVKSSSTSLTAPAAITFSIQKTGSLTCPGEADVSFTVQNIQNKIGDVTYSWTSGETTATISNKGAGTYTVTVEDDQGCSTTQDTETLTDPPAHTVTISPSTDYNGRAIQCHGDDNGGLSATVTPPTGESLSVQSYTWTKGTTTLAQGASATSVNNLDAGNYAVVVTYKTVCTATATYELTQPDAVSALITVPSTADYLGQAISCYNAADGRVNVYASGGTATYTYQWDDAAASTTETVTGLPAGTYTVVITDINSCEGTDNITLDNPLPVDATLTLSDYHGFGVSCNNDANGSITTVAEGGTGTYTYNWSNGETTASISNLSAATYTLIITDNNNCTNTKQATITEPDALSFAVQGQQNIACFNGADGSITLEASGGVDDYQYSINNGTTWQTEAVFAALTAGDYTLTLKDMNNCTATTATTLTQPDIIAISFTDIEEALCTEAIGQATAVVTGGVPAYTYRWENTRANVVDTDDQLTNVLADIYTLTVEDTHGCQMQGNVAITSTDGASVTYTATDTRCFNTTDGSAALTITGGASPYTTTWPDGQVGIQASGLAKGNYNVLVTDADDCVVVQPVTISGPESIQMRVVSQTPPSCNGLCDGVITIEATGGANGYTYTWNNNSGATQTGLCAGEYPVVMTDANNCVLNDTLTLTQPDLLALAVTNTTLATCRDGCDGALQVQASGGNAGYQYTWAIGGSTNAHTNLCPGDYAVTVVDQKNCQLQQTVTLPNTPAISLNLGGGVTLCVGQTYDLDAGEDWTSIAWGSDTNFNSNEQQITITDPGIYWLEVYNAHGCIAQDTFLMETSTDLLQASFLIPQDGYTSDTIVMADISWPLPETTDWSYPSQMEVLANTGDVLMGTFSDPGTYTLGLTVYLGECVDNLSKSITILRKLATDDSNGRLGYEAFVKKFELYPNPNDGVFEVGVELAEESVIILSVWNATNGMLIQKKQYKNQDTYHAPFDLRPLSAGAYVLRLDHERGTAYLRFMVY